MANAQTIQVNLKVMGDVQDVISNMSQVQKALTSLKLPDNLKNSFSKTFQDITKETTKIQGIMSSGFKNKGDVTALEKSYQKINQLIFGLQNNLGKITPNILQESFQIDTQALEKATQEVEKFKKQLQADISTAGLDGITQKVKELTDAGKGGKSLQNFFEQLKSGNFSAAEKSIKTLESSLAGVETRLKNSGKDTSGIEEYRNKIEQIHNAFNTLVGDSAVQQTNDQLIKALQNVQNLNQTELTNFINQFNNTKTAVEGLPPQINKISDAQKDAGRASVAMANDMDQLRSRIQYFFGLTSAVNLFKRAVKSAFDTVKELDKTMTEAAVVTEFDVSDMWSQLPTYASQAKALGATINDLYGATTLYYQQGLKTKEAMELGNETLRMARIGSLDAADATQYMTAALRGFNMEINQTSGERVNDVYSKLAAITASDTAQIAIAMSKTASIANSANMEFENTAALLSQIIETTQEAPETAGTALKTIIARFSEVKKLTEKGLFSGEDEEGEIIEVNKISSALASVGISMNKFFAGEEGLDSILMKLASKWDSLDFSTQRYIATAAAGSRQQSRFIAMMSNYDRTLELADAASNSAGASQEQFGKTLESLDSKLNKLKDAWDQFTMGLANSDLIKGAIDALTGFLDAINKIINGISGGKGFAKTITSAFLAFGAFKLGKNALGFGNREGGLLQALIGNKKQISKQGKEISLTFAESVKQNLGRDAKGNGILKDYFTTKTPFDASSFIKNGNFDKQAVLGSLDSQNPAYEALFDKTMAADKAIQQFGVDSDEAKKALEDLNNSAEKAGAGIQKTSTNLNAVAHASQLAGAGLIALSSAFDTTTKGGRVASGVIKGIGVGLLSFGTILPMVSSAFKTFGLEVSQTIWNIPIVGWIAGVISALIALGTILANAVDWRSSLERAEDGLKTLQELVDKTKESYDNLNNSIEEIENQRSAIDKMVAGTLEWNQAVAELNEKILELVKNSEFINFSDIKIEDSGLMTIDSEILKNAQEQELKTYTNQQRARDSQELFVKREKYNQQLNEAYNFRQNYSNARTDGIWFENEQFNTISKKLSDNGLLDIDLIDQPQFKSFLQSLDLSALDIEKFGKELKEIGKTYTDKINLATDFEKEYNTQASLSAKQAISRMNIGNDTEKSKVANNLLTGELLSKKISEKYDAINKEDFLNNSQYLSWVNESFGANATVSDKKGTIRKQTWDEEEKKYVETIISAEDAVYQFAQSLTEIDLQKSINEIYSSALSNDNDITKKVLTGQSLTSKELSQVNDIPDFIKGTDFESIWSNNLEKEKIRNNQVNAQITKDLGREFLEYLNENNLTSEAKQNIADQYEKSDSLRGKGFANTWLNEVKKVLQDENIDDDLKNQLFEFLNVFDSSKINSIDDFYEALDKAGLSSLKTSKSIASMIEALNEAQKAFNGFSTENVKTNILKNSDYRKELSKKEDLTFSGEEKAKAVVEFNIASENDFVQTGEDQWQYVSGPINNLISALNANTEAQLEDGKKRLEKQIEVAEQAERFSRISSQNGAAGYQSKFFNNNLENTTTKTTIEALAAYAGTLNATKTDEIFTNIDTGEKYSYNDLITDESLAQTIYNQIVEAMAFGSENLKNQLLNYENDSILNKTSDETSYSVGFEEQNRNGEVYATSSETTDKYVRSSVLDEANDLGLDQTSIVASSEALKQLQLDSQQTRDRLALDIAKMNQAAETITNNFEEWSVALDEGVANPKYQTSLNDFTKAASQMLGVTEKTAAALLKEKTNRELVAKAAKNDTAAMKKLQKAASKETMMEISAEVDDKEVQANISEIQNWLENTELPDMEVGTSIDSDPVYAAFADMINNAGLTAEQMTRALESMQFSPEVEYKQMTLGQAKAAHQVSYLKNADGSMTKVESDTNLADEGLVWVPQINGKGTVKAPPKPKMSKSKGGGGGGGGGSKKQEKQHWENPYDKLYNVTEKINETLRDREALERAYDRLLQNRDASAQKLLKNSRQQIQNLKEEAKLQQQIVNGRASQLKNAKNEDYLGKKKVGDEEEEFWTTFQKEATRLGLGNLDNYATYNQSTGLLQINWDKIEALENDEKTGEDKGNLIEKYVSYLEEQSKSFEEAQDRLDEINDEVYEIEQRGKEEYLDFSQRIIDAIINQQQKQIDTLSELDDTITDTNSRILDGIQEQVDLSRQIRDNTKTEDEIAKKEARLAYLRRDTSGANALEIKKLEEELNDARENYSDQLVDQALQKLSDDNEKASQQRQDQIELMQTQLDYWTEIGAFNARMEELFSGAFNKDGTLNNNSELVKLLQDTEGFQALSKFGKEDWMQKLAEDFYAATEGQSNFKVDEAKANKKIASGMAVNTSGNSVGALTYNSSKGWVSSTGTYGTISWDESLGKYIVDNYTANPNTTSSTTSTTSTATAGTSAKGKLSSLKDGKVYNNGKAEIKKLQEGINSLIADKKISGVAKLATDGIYGAKTKAAVKVIQKMIGVTADGLWGKNTSAAFKKSSLKAYKLGGLADFTGPAWLDGSKSKPEMVLNPQDTKNFIILKDVLGKLLEGDNLSSEKGGDNYYEIHINVDEIANDYDVDKLIDKVKKEINNDARYRNVNAINLLR